MTAYISDGVDYWGREAPDKQALLFGDESVSYGELSRWVNGIVANLAQSGIMRGTVVGLFAGSSLEYAALSLAVVKVGAIVASFPHRFVAHEVAHLIQQTDPVTVFADNDHMATLVAAAAVAETPTFESASIEDLNSHRDGPAELTLPTPSADDTAVIVFTSGTTSTPKGVTFTHANVLAMILEWRIMEPGFGSSNRQLMVLPLGGMPGTIWGTMQVTVNGGTLVIEPSFVPSRALRILEEQRITTLTGVPLMFEQMLAQDGFANADLSSMEIVHVGGARVPPALLTAWADKGVLLRQIYGMTEAGGTVTVTPRDRARARPESCGRGGLFSKVAVVRPDGSNCDRGEAGDVRIQGPACTPGYWRNPEATAAFIVDGWLHTGDIGMFDDDGYFRFVDRSKDLIISGGMNISPSEIEHVISGLEGVVEAAVVPTADLKFGETPAAIVRVSNDVAPEDVVQHCSQFLAAYKVPRYVIIASEPLPRMPSGKLARRQLAEVFPDISTNYPKIR